MRVNSIGRVVYYGYTGYKFESYTRRKKKFFIFSLIYKIKYLSRMR